MEEERVWGGRNRGSLWRVSQKCQLCHKVYFVLACLENPFSPAKEGLLFSLSSQPFNWPIFKGWWRWESPGYWCWIQMTWHCPSPAWFPSSSLKSFPEAWVIWKSPKDWSQPRKYWKIDPNGKRRWKRWREETVWAEGQGVDSMHKGKLD